MTTNTVTASKITYRKTKSGEWVVCGPTGVVQAGADVTVTKRDGSTKVEHVERVGREFDGQCYGYLGAATSAPARRSSRRSGDNWSRRSCPTGGNCSSFGTGATCGADECDGW